VSLPMASIVEADTRLRWAATPNGSNVGFSSIGAVRNYLTKMDRFGVDPLGRDSHRLVFWSVVRYSKRRM
jgi:hypothetical protein